MNINILSNPDVFESIAMSVEDGLSDLAFEKGWRISEYNIPWSTKKLMPFLREDEFYDQYLKEEEDPEVYAEFYGQVDLPLYVLEKETSDFDEDEIDHEFHFQEAPLTEDAEFNIL